MREIKFRAWTGKEMRFPPELGEWDWEDCELFAGYNKKPTILMQYIGMHDKNGKEIYEGDIVIFDNVYDHRKPEVVECLEGAPGFSPFCDDEEAEGCAIYPDPDKCKVIGNIYENNELLEVKV